MSSSHVTSICTTEYQAYRSKGISISNYAIEDTPMSYTFVPENVALGSGSVDLKVSAYNGTGNVQSSEILTQDIFKFASVRTVLKSSGVPGVVEGNFFYCKRVLRLSIVSITDMLFGPVNDNQETDWEILTSTTLSPSADVPAGIWATNQVFQLCRH